MTEVAKTPIKRTFKKTANITLELLKIAAGVEYYVRPIGAMHVGKAVAPKVEVDKATGEVKTVNKEPAMVMFIDNLEDDQERIMICSTVLRKELAEAYPNDGYVGKTIGFKQTKVAGKDYNLVELWEVEDPTPSRSAEVVAKFAASQKAGTAAVEAVAEVAKADTKAKTK